MENVEFDNRNEQSENEDAKSENDQKNDSSKKEERPKRRVGRPSKSVIKQPKPKNGVVTSPSDARHYMEFLYDKPLIFRKLWSFFKLMAVDKIHLSFLKDSIIMNCSDHHKKSNIRVTINCNEVNHYYCKNELDIGLLCKNPELIMSTIDKSYNSLLLLSTHDNVQKNIQIVLKNDIDIEETHKIELIGEYDRVETSSKFLDDDYMIKFTLPGKYFKKMISDIRTFSDQITIKQDDKNEALMFEYVKCDKKIKSLHVIKNNKSISLESKLKEDDTFRTSFKIDYVKPLSSSIMSEHIKICADENKPLLFIIDIDACIQVRVLTDIVDNRS
jgi:hypothetical protein